MNSNSYLSLSHHPSLIAAADAATHEFGVGPGAVRFIDGTFEHHVELERRVARFVDRPAAKIFNSAYTANLGLALTLANRGTFWVGDELNHNCIIRGMRIANVPREQRSIYAHNDMAELARRLEEIPAGIERVIVIFDGIFSMRGDCASLAEIEALIAEHHVRFPQGVISVVDDSHGIGAFGATGRGTEEFRAARADVMVGTFGKAFGVNGGFVAGSEELIEAIRQKADTYIYTNPLSVADCAAASVALELADSEEGRERLRGLHERIAQFRNGVEALGIESIPGPHPVVPLLIRDTQRTRRWVQALFERGVLVVGLTFPVVPEGDETIRVQINAAHTERDIEELLAHLAEVKAAD
jgi:glycine C-acetyltransferase